MSSPLHHLDFYKTGHGPQYPTGTELVFSNWTARGSRDPNVSKVILFGLQYYTKRYLVEEWRREFFDRPKEEVVARYQRRMKNAGITIDVSHIGELHDLQYLPLTIWALPEGTAVPLGVPMFVMWNTQKEFFWLTNYIETAMSSVLWRMCTSATIALQYRRKFEEHAEITGGDKDFIDWQGHDFSFRGQPSPEVAAMSGAGHLLSFSGTDTIPAIDLVEEYYDVDTDEVLVGGSVPATEHSVMCMGMEDGEQATFKRLITEVHPSGPISIVADTWDYWRMLTEYAPALKPEIYAREGGPVVFRPDSGDPVMILTGDPNALRCTPEYEGSFQLLWNQFGGTMTQKGYRVLDSHVSLIYGDSITLDRCAQILSNLEVAGYHFSGVLGIGSFTYQYVTRDTFGFALKATYGEVNGEGRAIFKDPKTDSGEKKSAKGLLAVRRDDNGELWLKQEATWEDVRNCEFNLVFTNGDVYNEQRFVDVRDRVRG